VKLKEIGGNDGRFEGEEQMGKEEERRNWMRK